MSQDVLFLVGRRIVTGMIISCKHSAISRLREACLDHEYYSPYPSPHFSPRSSPWLVTIRVTAISKRFPGHDSSGTRFKYTTRSRKRRFEHDFKWIRSLNSPPRLYFTSSSVIDVAPRLWIASFDKNMRVNIWEDCFVRYVFCFFFFFLNQSIVPIDAILYY